MERALPLFLLSAVFLYLAGVVTGVYLGSKSAVDITSPLRIRTLQLEKKMGELEKRLSNTMDTLYILQLLSDRATACKVVANTLDPILSEIASIVDLLPPRLEVASIPPNVENKYASLNSRAYLAANYIFTNCGGEKLPVLYLYEHNDVESGLTVDKLKKEYNILVFVAWGRSNDPLVKALRPDRASLYVCGKLVDIGRAREVLRECFKRYSS